MESSERNNNNIQNIQDIYFRLNGTALPIDILSLKINQEASEIPSAVICFLVTTQQVRF